MNMESVYMLEEELNDLDEQLEAVNKKLAELHTQWLAMDKADKCEKSRMYNKIRYYTKKSCEIENRIDQLTGELDKRAYSHMFTHLVGDEYYEKKLNEDG